MKKTNQALIDDMRPEYDFASMKCGVRGKYARRARAWTNIVLVEPEVADAFPTEEAAFDGPYNIRLHPTHGARSRVPRVPALRVVS